jgi:D-arabinose 1-dehydrogenase-like Zn-dependent alcohol dehydrogenase
MGSDAEFEHMLDFVQQYQIIPIIDSIYSLDNAAAAFKHMESGNQFGKIVLQHS